MPTADVNYLTGVPEASLSRWEPLRAGVLNVFRYDDQQFVFHKGRLLLRGLNGSGKSVALEVLLPYLFDADLSPERLSTFGGRDRSLWWKLIGWDDSGRDNARGYVWLEFGRLDENGTPQYVTIGAGLEGVRSDRSKTRAWYWTASGRPGIDFHLSNEHREPHNPARLSDALSGLGTVHASAVDYREAVNRSLFGLSPVQFAALRRMLLELRRPHLSQGLDPTRLSDLLSDSLPPLDTSIITQLAAGFDGLDKHSNDLTEMQQTVDEIGSLLTSYRTYARRLSRSRAQGVLAARDRYVSALLDRDTAEEAVRHAQAQLEAVEADLTATTEALDSCQGRLRGLEESEEYRSGRSLAESAANAERAAAVASAARVRAEASRDRLGKARERAASARAQAEAAKLAYEERLGKTRAAAEGASMAHAVDTLQVLIGQGQHAAAGERLAELLRDRKRQVESVRQLIRRAADLDRQHLESVQAVAALEEQAATASATSVAAGSALDNARVDYATSVRSWASGTACFDASVLRVDDTVDLEDPAAVRATVNALAATQRAALLAETARISDMRKSQQSALEGLRSQHRELSKAEAVLQPPAVRERTGRERPGAPLFMLIDFAPTVPVADRPLLEAALLDSGLLDAWVQPDGGTDPCALDVFATDTGDRPHPNLTDALVPVPHAEVTPAAVTAVLSNVQFSSRADELTAPTAVGADGSWRAGTLAGRAVKSAVEFIGATARELARTQALAEVSGRVEALQAEVTALQQQEVAVGQRLVELDAELRTLPGEQSVLDAQRALDRAVSVHDERGRSVERARAAVAPAAERRDAAAREVAAAATAAGLPREPDALSAAARNLDALSDAGRDWIHAAQFLERADTTASDAAGDALAVEEQARSDEETAAALEAESRALSSRHEALAEAMGRSFEQVLSDIKTAQQESKQHQIKLRRLQEERLSVNGSVRDAMSRVREKAQAVASAGIDLQVQTEEQLKSIEHGLYKAAGLEGCLAELPATGSPGRLSSGQPEAEQVAVAEAVDKTVTEASSADAIEKALNRVTERRYEVERAIGERVTLRQRSDNQILVVDAVYRGSVLSLPQLAETLAAEIAQTSVLLESAERDLFENFLAGQVRKEVSTKMRAADELIGKINELMLNCPTASTVRLRLKWQVDEEAAVGITDVVDLLRQDPGALADADRAALEKFFRLRIAEVRAQQSNANWSEQLLAVLDYRRWYTFTLQRRQADKPWEDLTRSKHAAMSGGEKAVALHLPLFAAAAAHYAAATVACPRFILLDEVFAGVDSPMRGRLFKLACEFDLDMIATSESEQGTHADLDGIAIYQLVRADGMPGLLAVRSVWDGRELHRLLDADLVDA